MLCLRKVALVYLNTMLLALGMGIFFLVVGWFVFARLERHFAEEL